MATEFVRLCRPEIIPELNAALGSSTELFSISRVSTLGSSSPVATKPKARDGLLSKTTSDWAASVSCCPRVTPVLHANDNHSVMRLGKPIEHLQAALKAAQDLSRPGEGITTIGRQLSYAAYLFFDAFAWVQKSVLCPLFMHLTRFSPIGGFRQIYSPHAREGEKVRRSCVQVLDDRHPL